MVTIYTFTEMNRRRNLVKFVLDEDSSDDDEEFIFTAAQLIHQQYMNDQREKHGGSVFGHQVVDRNRLAGHQRLYNDYFSEEPTYGPIYFRRRFVIFFCNFSNFTANSVTRMIYFFNVLQV